MAQSRYARACSGMIGNNDQDYVASNSVGKEDH
jgi:hypothetical protein